MSALFLRKSRTACVRIYLCGAMGDSKAPFESEEVSDDAVRHRFPVGKVLNTLFLFLFFAKKKKDKNIKNVINGRAMHARKISCNRVFIGILRIKFLPTLKKAIKSRHLECTPKYMCISKCTKTPFKNYARCKKLTSSH